MQAKPNRLLVIDDEPDICDFIAEVAEDLGFDTTVTDSPDEFRNCVSSYAPTVIALDLQMPRADGVELLRFLAEESCPAHILVASGMDSRVLATAEELGTSRGLKMLGSLQKPIELEHLEGALKRAMREQRNITVEALDEAILTGQLVVHFQPKAARREPGVWHIDAVEALVRWDHPDYGLVMPGEFIGVAEGSGLAVPLADYVFRSAMEQARVWNENGLDLTVAVNLSAQLLDDLEFPDRLTTLMREYDMHGSRLMLELTETAAMNDPGTTMDILTRLRVREVGLSIDDFGTGYSSLKQLYRMPFNELKIDNSFIADVEESDEARTMVESMIYLGHKLHMDVCAEGVETRKVLDFLDQAGCDKAQGYHFSPAIPAAEVEAFVRDWNGKS